MDEGNREQPFAPHRVDHAAQVHQQVSTSGVIGQPDAAATLRYERTSIPVVPNVHGLIERRASEGRHELDRWQLRIGASDHQRRNAYQRTEHPQGEGPRMRNFAPKRTLCGYDAAVLLEVLGTPSHDGMPQETTATGIERGLR